jgi:prepilin peptidase CpaA
LFIVASGLVSSTPLPVYGWAAAFLFFAVLSDVRFHRIPNWLTLSALFGALLASPWAGATSGPIESAAGAALGFALLVGPYALGGMGAGDVKALMALGAWLGPVSAIEATAWAVIVAGVFSVIMLSLNGEIIAYARRWARMIVKSVASRKVAYEAPISGSVASGGIPFAAAIAVGLAAHWYGGPPW